MEGMIKTLNSLADSASLINALVNNPHHSKQDLERLARNYRHLEITLDKPEVVNSGESLTEYTKALEAGAAYLKQHAPHLLK